MSSHRKLVFAAILTFVAPQVARADLVGHPSGAPSFTANERATIARNATLGALEATDPWLVRRALDELAALPSTKALDGQNPDPDLDRLRTSAEGLNDLFQVIKAAAGKRNPSSGTTSPATTK